jgi:hypothetical protein
MRQKQQNITPGRETAHRDGMPLRKLLFAKLTLLVCLHVLSACNIQNNMLYYPTPYLPSAEKLAALDLQYWPPDSSEYRGFLGTILPAPARGTIVVFHGNADTAAERTYYTASLAPLGFRVILAEYPGYGRRPGAPGEVLFVNDGRETVRLVAATYGKPVFLLGESLGAGVAAAVAKNSPVDVDGLILVTPWDTLLAVARGKFPWLPVRLFLTDRYDTVENLKSFAGRTAIIAAERDDIIPINHALALYQSLPGNKRMWTIKAAGHNDWPGFIDASYWKEVTDFITRK